jgi:outer membrane protein assembly factor BamB
LLRREAVAPASDRQLPAGSWKLETHSEHLMLKTNTAITGATAFGLAVAFATIHAQVGRGGSEWLTAGGDAQRTSWIRTDAHISVDSMSKPGFELQWTTKLENPNRQAYGLGQGVSASGVTLFVPLSVVTGSSNNVYGIDSDTGYVVWQRHFEAPMSSPTASCPGGTTSAATRIVSLTPPPIAAPPTGGGRAAPGYRSVLGEPGAGAPVDVRGRPGAPPVGAGAGDPQRGRESGAGQRGADQAARSSAAAAPQRGGAGRDPAVPPIPGAPADQFGRGGLGRPSGVVYAISSDGVLHVMGLPSGKDIQRPAPFVPANSRWSDPIVVNTTLYTSTSGGCGGAPDAVWAIDLDTENKPVVSWKSGGPIVGALAFTTDGTLVAVTGPAIVTLDGKTLQPKASFKAPDSEFVTGATIFKQGEREIIAAATHDGRIVLVDATSPGGANHPTPLAMSSPGDRMAPASDALASWQEMTIVSAPAPAPAAPGAAPAGFNAPPAPSVTLGARWILVSSSNSVTAVKISDAARALLVRPGWNARAVEPATPIVVNGVVFVLETGRSATAGGEKPAVLHAYEGSTGKELWTSQQAMKAPAAPGSFWSAFGQVYVGTADGTLYAFGFADERR